MADMKPFRGYRYSLKTPDELGNFTSPPYDMLTDPMIDDLYRRDPHNVVRIIQNKPQPQDSTNKDRHVRAGKFLGDWIASGVLVRDPKPLVYVYRQQFTVTIAGKPVPFERTGVTVLLRLVDFSEGIVLPHEYTLSAPKKDRYENLEALRANTGQIFGIVEDSGDFLAAVRGCMSVSPAGTFSDMDNVKHSIYVNNTPEAISRLTKLLAGRTILIADGHHRYETALQFSRDTGDPLHRYVMMTLVSMADPGLIIRSFHRMIRKSATASVADPVAALRGYFDLRDSGAASSETLNQCLGRKRKDEMFYLDSKTQRVFTLTVNAGGETFLKKCPLGQSDAWNHLDVSKINLVFINGILSLPLDGQVLHDAIEYEKDPGVVLSRCAGDGEFTGAFLIHPVDINTISRIVANGERMPQKSTNFFPKYYSGLVINSLRDE